MHGVLTSDILMKNIYCYIAKEGYAARVKDTKSYDSIRYDGFTNMSDVLNPKSSAVARISSHGGLFPSCQTTAIPADISTNIFEVTSTSRKTILSPFRGE